MRHNCFSLNDIFLKTTFFKQLSRKQLFNFNRENLIFLLTSIHPFMPLLATSSGQRQFPWPSDSEDDSGPDGKGVTSPRESREDNTLRVWWAGPLGTAAEGSGDQSADAAEEA